MRPQPALGNPILMCTKARDTASTRPGRRERSKREGELMVGKVVAEALGPFHPAGQCRAFLVGDARIHSFFVQIAPASYDRVPARVSESECRDSAVCVSGDAAGGCMVHRAERVGCR